MSVICTLKIFIICNIIHFIIRQSCWDFINVNYLQTPAHREECRLYWFFYDTYPHPCLKKKCTDKRKEESENFPQFLSFTIPLAADLELSIV